MLDRYEIERREEWDKWRVEIPALQFPPDWKVKIIPPFAGAIVRFVVEKGEKSVSVYLDCYDKLGCFGAPYWELYPYGDDVCRVAMAESTELIQRIQESLDA